MMSAKGAAAVLEEEYERSIARQRTIWEAKEAIRKGDLATADVYILRAVEMLSASEDRVMRLHAECVSMLEHAGRILTHYEATRPLVVSDVQSGGQKP
jgi:hypothetical protein